MLTRLTTLLVTAALTVSPAAAQGYKPVQGPHTLNPGDWPAHYPFSDETEAAVAAPEVHHVRYVDDHVRLVEVAYFPGVVGQMHGHPYPSVFAVDAPVPKGTNTTYDPAHNMKAVVSTPPEGATFPYCRAASPQNPHHETNLDTWPHHFMRLEFLRIDGAAGARRGGEWYASKEHTRVLFEDDHARLVEVLIRPGETWHAPSNPYSSVIASDAADVPLPHGAGAHESPVLAGFETLKCVSAGGAAAGVVHNTGAAPIHYYRIDFKRIDGAGLKDHWREWYPWMATMKDAYDRSPTVPNF